MRRRHQPNGRAAKTQRCRALKRGVARKATRHNSAADKKTKVVRITRERDEALEQLAATSEVLRVIRRSPPNVQPVFDMIAESAARLCEAQFCFVWRFDGQLLHFVAHRSVHTDMLEIIQGLSPWPPDQRSAAARAILTRDVVQIPDVTADPNYAPIAVAAVGGYRSAVAVPILRDGLPIGSIAVTRAQAGLLPNRQIELLKTFADQAGIAIENAELLSELRDRTLQLEAQSQEVAKLNQQLERRVVDQVGEIERMSRLRRFLSPQVADLIIASGMEKQLESHRREITALFCDLRGFTGFSEKSDPEDVMSLLRDYHAAIGEIIIKYSGTLEHYAGDGVMVFFNDPIPVPNPALQAVRTALDMRMAIESLTEKWRRLGHELGFGIGIAHGFATLGTIGFEGRFDYAAIGTVSNVASRLCDEAKPGQILISSRVLMAVEDAMNFEPVGDFALKGISCPVAAYNILSAVSSKA